ncbi:MAG: NAD(P)-binding domain-containing protein, partial [Geminicoccaceae bacterium]|nr:NAD(P)-binding domain-containing protein [Geminicoccaceae bacterium]
MRRIGFVGLGVMGGPMALNLIEAGFELTVFDLDPAALSGVERAGAARAGDL